MRRLCGGRDGDVILPASSLRRCVCSKVDSGQSTTPCLSARLLYAQAALPFRLLISAGHAHRIIELVTGDKIHVESFSLSCRGIKFCVCTAPSYECSEAPPC